MSQLLKIAVTLSNQVNVTLLLPHPHPGTCILPAVVVGHDYVVVEVEELEQVEVGNRVVHGEAAAAIAVVRPR